MIYLDNSATTYPKPSAVRYAVNQAMLRYSFNSGRGGYKESSRTSSQIFSVRERVGKFVGCEPQNVIFTQNCTMALNMAIKGLVKNGDHILISNLEHNAVARPVNSLALKGIITFDVFDFDYNTDRLISNINAILKSNTRMIVCTQASNAFGCAFPISEIAALARKKGIYFIVDGAQGAGIFDVSCEKDCISAYCAAGHKGLYGPMATGFLALNDSVKPHTIVEGGTGSSSAMLTQPLDMPEGLESGTLDNSGIIGLGAGIDFVSKKGIENIYSHELNLVRFIYDELCKNSNVTLYTPKPEKYKSAPIISFNFKDFSSEKSAAMLAEAGISVRGGLHCAPMAHSAFSTLNRGTVRVSPSAFTSKKECEIFINSLKKL